MSGSGKNNRGETDSIKEMLERLRRSVTDLPPEPEENVQEVQPSSTTEEPIVEEAGQTPIAEIVAEIEKDPAPIIEEDAELEPELAEPFVGEQEQLSPEANEADGTEQHDGEMILVPWDEDAPIAEEAEEEIGAFDSDDLPENKSDEPEIDVIVDEDEDFEDLDDIDEETIAQFFQPVEEQPESDESSSTDPAAADQEEPTDDLPADFIDVTEEEEEADLPENIAYSTGAPVITEDEVALLFGSGRPAMPKAPAVPPKAQESTNTPIIEANEDNGYAVEVEVKRPASISVMTPAEATQEAPHVAPMYEPAQESVHPPVATPGLSNGSTVWRDDQKRRRPVEVLEDIEIEDNEPIKLGDVLGKNKSAEKYAAENEEIAPEQSAKTREKIEKKATKPYGPGKQLTIDDIKESAAPEDANKPGLLARLFAKKASKSEAESTFSNSKEETASFDIQNEKVLRQIQKEERRNAPKPKPKRAQEALGGLYREEAAAYHEYTSRNQMSLFQQKFESELSFLALRTGILSFLAVLMLVLENGLGWGLPMERLFVVPISMAALHLLLVFFALLCCIPLFAYAWRQLFARRLVAESFAAIGLLLALLYDAILCFSLIPQSGALTSVADLRLFGLLPVTAALLSTVVEFNKVKSDLAAFRLVSASGDKLACAVSSGGATKAESAAIVDLEEGVETRIVSVKKTGFTTGFFHRISRNCEDEQKNMWLLPTAGVAALLVAIVTGVLERDVLAAIYAFCVTLALALPACTLVLHKIPVSLLFRMAEKNSCAVAGEVSALEYSDTGAFAFEDVEAFPARNVRVQRIKLYNDSALDHVLYQVSGVFSAVGGPLDGVFRSSTAELGLSSDVRLLQVADGGIIASVDGRRVCVGCGDFMLKKHVRMYYDAEDEQNLAAGKACIMYAAEEGQLCAKFYIRYRMDEAFERDVERLSANGIRTLIRTYDPNIREALIKKVSYTGRFGIRVVKKTIEQQNDFAAAQLNSGIITSRSVREILCVLLACRRTCRLTSYSEAGGLVLGCLGMLLSIVLATLGVLTATPSLLLCLYQLFWVLPVLLASKLYITRK